MGCQCALAWHLPDRQGYYALRCGRSFRQPYPYMMRSRRSRTAICWRISARTGRGLEHWAASGTNDCHVTATTAWISSTSSLRSTSARHCAPAKCAEMSRQARTTVRGFCGEGVNKPRARLRGCYTARLSNNAARAWHYDEFRGGGCESRGNLTCYEDGNPPTPITSSTLIVNDAQSPRCARKYLTSLEGRVGRLSGTLPKV